MVDSKPVVGVVGSGIAGLRAANAMLKCEVDARIVIFGDEYHRTYSRPGLSKRRYLLADALDTAIARDLTVNGAENSALTWRLGSRVDTADLRHKSLRLSTGEEFDYDSLVIAAGVRSRTSIEGCELHLHSTLRGLDDAQRIHRELQKSERVTIAGAGFVACELASLATEYGCDVIMLEALRSGPFESLLGKRISAALRRWIVQHSVEFVTGNAAKQLLCGRATVPARAASAVTAPDRSLFIEAIGSVPNVEWLRGNGLDLSDGVRVDEYMRVPEYEDVYAAGDIARYPDPWAAGSLTRMEFWRNAIDTGDLAGRSVAASLGYGSKVSHIGYFPSMTTEVFGLRIQIAGNPRLSDAVEVECGDLDQPDHGVIVRFLREYATVGVAYLDKGARFNKSYLELLKSLKGRRGALV